MSENSSDLWLRQWLFFSLKMQLSANQQLRFSLSELASVQPATPLIIGISGAQGSGKTTLAQRLQQLWQGLGVQTDVLSLDDYYLAPDERQTRAQLWQPLFAERGVPGTHDSELLLLQLQQFRRGQPQCWRRYDKALDQTATSSPASSARLLIIEGWCLGVQPQADAELLQPLNSLERQSDPQMHWRQKVNQLLASDYQQIWRQLDTLVWLKAPDWQAVCRWRQWQEQPLQAKGLAKTPRELDRFMLYFQRLTQHSWLTLPQRADFTLMLDSEHNFVSLIPDV